MRKKARWLLTVVLTIAMVMGCMPAASAKEISPQKGKASNPWGINVDISGVPGQVQATVANMIAQGEEPLEKQSDAFLAEVVEEASGISFEAVKTSLGLELLQGNMGTMDTSRFNLGEEEFNRVMKEVLSEYFLTDVAYECDVEDGIVTDIWFMPANDAPSYRGMFTVSDLWSMYRAPLTASTMSASRMENDPAPLSEDDGEGETGTDPAVKEVTLQVKWKDNNKKANRPQEVTLRLTSTDKSDTNSYYYKFDGVADGQATIVVPNKDGVQYTLSEDGVGTDYKLNGKNGATYTVTYKTDGDTYTAINTANGENGKEYDVTFNWARNDQYVQATEDEIAKGASVEIGGVDVALTLVYDAEKKEVGYGPKTTIDFKLESVTLTPKDGDGSARIVIDVADDKVSYRTMYACQGNEVPDPSVLGDYASYASTIKYGTYDCDYGTFEDRLDVTASAEQIHWNQMLAFTRDFAKHFGTPGDFWTSKNTENTPYGAFKTQLDSYPDDYMPDSTMDYYMENLTLSYMADEMSYGSLLDQKIADCMAQLDDSMTVIQKYLVIHDWIANNVQFDMGVMAKMMAGDKDAQTKPSQMTAFGALLYDAMDLDGCICLGYSATFALLVQHAFPEIYQKDDGDGGKTWKIWEEVGNDDIVDLVQIRFWANLAETSVAPPEGDHWFGSVHYYNAVKVGDEWYCIDSSYDDVSTEVMDQCRVETNGNISHKYFMIAPTNMLSMFEKSMDYIDCLYDGVVFERTRNEDGTPVEETKGGSKHFKWEQHDASKEQKCKDDQYEATWFTGAVGEVTHDDNYWYYVTGPSFSYASMMKMMNQMKDQMGGSGNSSQMSKLFNSDKASDKDRLVRRPRKCGDEPVKDESSSSGGGMGGMGMKSYDDPNDEILFHFGYGSVVPAVTVLDGEDEEAKKGKYYDQVVIDEAYNDMYPDLAHTMGMYDDVIYFNLGNKVYTMTGATTDTVTPESVTITQLKEYNDVYAKTDGRDFTGMSFYAVPEKEYNAKEADNAFHVFNRPIAAVSIEDKVTYKDQVVTDEDGNPMGQVKVRSGDPVPTLTVSIGTNFSESNKPDGAEKYTVEAVDYNPDYSRYTDDGNDDTVNNNSEFQWCANVVDTMPMAGMLAENAEDAEKVSVTVDAWCGQAGYTEQRTAQYGLSDGTGKVSNREDPALNHHYIYYKNYGDNEKSYICVHCGGSYHELPTGDDDYVALPEGATKAHYGYPEGETPEFVNVQWSEDYSTCTAQLKCAERHCDAANSDSLTCDVSKSEDTSTGTITYTAKYNDIIVSEVTPGHEHTLTKVDAKPATCTASGNKEYYKCDSCGLLFEDAEGKTETTMDKVTIPATGHHKWDEGKVTKEPTVDAQGEKTYTCTVCGETKIETIPALDHKHTLTKVDAKPATCTASGNKEYYKCDSCGLLFEDAEGKTETNMDKVTIPAGHKWGEWKVTKEPTCTEKGVKTHICTVCQATETVEIATVPHHYVNGVCTVCNAKKPSGGGGGGGGGREYGITIETAKNGKVTSDSESAMKDDVVTLTVTPNKGYALDTLTVAGTSGKALKLTEKNGVYTFEMPAYEVIVKATFKQVETAKSAFSDVSADAYYADAVDWAVENGITGGTTATTFSPNSGCTRAQAVTFLWRAAGSPAPKSSVNPFTDVAADAYYTNAVLWAVENGITKGTTATTFDPNATCTRAQIVTFLSRSESSPAVSGGNAFTDVPASAYYAGAVNWAVANNITGGTTATTFSPNSVCTRAQIVTFLYRALAD